MKIEVQPKIIASLDENGNLILDKQQAELLNLTEPSYNWKLVREHDGLTNRSVEVMWIEWDESGRFKARHDTPEIDRSLVMSPFNAFFTWQTTSVTEIVEQREDYVKFKTKNSVYELFKINE